MKYFYFLLVGIVSLAALYTVFGISYFKWINYQVHNPKAEFLIIENKNNNLSIVEFTNYACGYCKEMSPLINEALTLHQDVQYIPRPILFTADPDAKEKQEPAALEKLVMAAGMQGRFKEMHDAFMEHPKGIIPEETIKETANLYGIDYDKMVKDAQGKEVEKYLKDNISDMFGMNIQVIPSYMIGEKIFIIKEKLPSLQEFMAVIENAKNNNE